MRCFSGLISACLIMAFAATKAVPDPVKQNCRIIGYTGTVEYWIKSGSTWKMLDKGTSCAENFTIRTSEKSELTIICEPTISVTLHEKSVLSFDKMLIDHAQKAIRMRLRFQQGSCSVKMPAELGYTLLCAVMTPSASLYVSNADFSVGVTQKDTTVVEVARGAVKMLHAISDKKEIVYAEHRGSVEPGSADIRIEPSGNAQQSLRAKTKPLSVAILSVYSKSVPKENLEPLSDEIAQEIVRKSESNVLFLDEVRSMLRAEGIENLLLCPTDSCIAKIGSYLGVDLVVIGNLGQMGNRFVFNLKMIDALRDQTRNRVNVVVDNDIGLVFSKVPSMIDSLVTGKLTPQAEEPAAARHDDSTAHRKLYQEMVWVFPGSFLMGSDAKKGDIDEIPRHKVALDGFYIDKYEVSRESFERVMGYNPSKFNGCPNCPIDNISWFEADEYCRKSEKRLPTEAEWEYACRAGGDGPFNTGSAMGGTMANFNSEIPSGGVPKSPFRKKPVPCGSFKPNTWNLYDMHGNVWEWCADWYDIAYYGNAPEKNPRGPKDGRYKVARGGGWDSNGDALRSANRISYSPEIRMHVIGFRCVKDASE